MSISAKKAILKICKKAKMKIKKLKKKHSSMSNPVAKSLESKATKNSWNSPEILQILHQLFVFEYN